MASIGNIPVPSTMCMKGDVVANWDFFKTQWTNYEIATELDKKAASIRVATLLSVMGRECLLIFQHLAMTEADKKDVQKIIENLTTHFVPKRNVIYERFIFNSTTQQLGEPIEQYIDKLRQLISSCRYDAMADEFLRDRIVLGISDDKLRGRLLRDSTLTLDTATDMCKSHEAAQRQLQRMSTRVETDSVCFVRDKDNYASKQNQGQRNFQKSAYVVKCHFCGGSHERDKTKCPSYGHTCSKCGKLGHFPSVCRSMSVQSSKSHTARGHHKLKPVHIVDECESSEDSAYTVTHSIGAVGTKGKQWFVTLTLSTGDTNETEMKCQLDSGATCNVMSFKDYCRITEQGAPKLTKSDIKLACYGGNVLIPRGQAMVKCTYNGKQIHLSFQIVDTNQGPLLSGEACLQLNLISFNISRPVPTKKRTIFMLESQNPAELILRHSEVFTGLGSLPGDCVLILDPTIKPVQQAPRRVPVAMLEPLQRKLSELMELGVIAKVIEPTEWISNLVLVTRNQKLRLCLDPRELNKALRRAHYPMPVIEDVLPRLTNAKVFSVVDAKDGFWQVKLDSSSSLLTTFWTPFGRYKWLRMPFGISVAPEEFQRRIHDVISGLSGTEDIADDILVYGCGATVEEATADHDLNLEALLKRASEVGLKLNPKKLKLRLPSVTYMGHLLTAQGLRPDPEKTVAIATMPAPQNVTEVKSVMGSVTYLAKFLPSLSEVSEPLRQLTRQDAVWIWDYPQQRAWETIKDLVTRSPILRYYDVNLPLVIQCDASSYGLGATLLQEGQPVAFASRHLTPTECQYAQIEKECLAIVFACERFDQFACGRESVLIESDHKPLEVIFKKSLLSAPKRLQRMLLRLQRYSLDVRYKKGSEMYIADMLSRAISLENPSPTSSVSREVERINMLEDIPIKEERLRRIQEQSTTDPELSTLRRTILKGWPDSKTSAPALIAPYWQFREELTVQDGIILKGARIVIPMSLRGEMLKRTHSSHQGMEACLRKAREAIFWPGMADDIRDMIARCSICNASPAKQQKEPMLSHDLPDLPWQRVAMDLFSIGRKDYLVVVDFFSDFWELDELGDTSASTIIDCLKRHFSRHGVPSSVLSDNGPQFSSLEFRVFAQAWEFEHQTSSPYFSQANGKAEAAVKIAKRLIKRATENQQDPWRAILDWRNTPTEIIGSSPAQRLFSRRTRNSIPTTRELLHPEIQNNVKEHIRDRRQRAKVFYDRGSKPLPDLNLGQTVRLQPPPAKTQTGWQLGTCLEKVAPRSYMVQVNGSVYRRNRRFIRESAESPPRPFADAEDHHPVAPEPVDQHQKTTSMAVPDFTPCTPALDSTDIGGNKENTSASITRAGRRVNKPKYLDDFIC